jgi:[protein-PII] uridylyltransferase
MQDVTSNAHVAQQRLLPAKRHANNAPATANTTTSRITWSPTPVFPGGPRDIQTILFCGTPAFRHVEPARHGRPGFAERICSVSYPARNFSEGRYALHMPWSRIACCPIINSRWRTLLGLKTATTNAIDRTFYAEYYLRGDGEPSSATNSTSKSRSCARVKAAKRPNQQPLQVRNGYIEATHPGIFKRTVCHPRKIRDHGPAPETEGVCATPRLLRDHRHLIDDDFAVTSATPPVSRVTARGKASIASTADEPLRHFGPYLPEFGLIVGQMQHDLFHLYGRCSCLNDQNLRTLSKQAWRKSCRRKRVGREAAKPELDLLWQASTTTSAAVVVAPLELGADARRSACATSYPVDSKLIWPPPQRCRRPRNARSLRPAGNLRLAHLVGNQTRLDYLYVPDRGRHQRH